MNFWKIGVAGLVALTLASCGGLPGGSAAQPTTTLPPVVEDPRVIAEAVVVPQESVSLSWATSGTVAAVLVDEGDQVAAGDPLTRVDTRELELALQRAHTQLTVAQADRAALLEGASSEEIATYEAQLARAQSQLQEARGSVTPQDVAAAQARVEEARTRLAQLQAGPETLALQQAEAKVAQAATDLQAKRDSLSAAKTKASLALEKSTADLERAQSSYATAKKNWDYVQETGKHPSPAITGTPTAMEVGRVDDVSRQRYYDTFVQSEAALRSAEASVTQAQVDYDNARQAEVTGVQQAEQSLSTAQNELADLGRGAEPEDVAAARAALQSAQADLSKLQGQQRSGTLGAAEASVAEAQARLAELQVGPQASSLSRAEAEVAQAELAIKEAELALDLATLKSPIAGTVAEVNLKVGETVTQTAPVVLVADMSAWRIETTDLTELRVVPVQVGDAAVVTFDAIPGLELPGKVTEIQLVGKDREGDITYQVVVVPDTLDPRLRWNMTAVVAITPSTPVDP